MKWFILFVALLPAGSCSQGDITGTWQGTLAAGPARVRVVFNIAREDGRLVATIDSPDQGASGIPVAGVEYANRRLRLDASAVGAGFEGRLEGDRITGEWLQAGRRLPLVLTRADGPVESRRPQDPVPPYPYHSEEVSFPGPAGLVAGTLVLPQGAGPFPAALLVSGSGQQDRDQRIHGHRPFLVLADYLVRRGVVVLRCDDRGIGGSTGDPTAATTEDFARDAGAALEWLRERPEVDPARTGVIGHSEGALVGAMLAARGPGPDFLVMLAGPGIPGSELLPVQGERLMRAGGASEAAIAANRRIQERLFATVRRGAEPGALAGELELAFAGELQALDPVVQAELSSELTPQAVAAQVRALSSPWFGFFLEYEPAQDLRQVMVPVLALWGSKDLQTPPDHCLPAVEAALRAGGNPDFAVRELPGLNHLFQTAGTGSVIEYGRIQETFAPAALEAIGDWLAERFGNSRQ